MAHNIIITAIIICEDREFECTLEDCVEKCDGKEDCPSTDDDLLCTGKPRCRIEEFRYWLLFLTT